MSGLVFVQGMYRRIPLNHLENRTQRRYGAMNGAFRRHRLLVRIQPGSPDLGADVMEAI